MSSPRDAWANRVKAFLHCTATSEGKFPTSLHAVHVVTTTGAQQAPRACVMLNEDGVVRGENMQQEQQYDAW